LEKENWLTMSQESWNRPRKKERKRQKREVEILENLYKIKQAAPIWEFAQENTYESFYRGVTLKSKRENDELV